MLSGGERSAECGWFNDLQGCSCEILFCYCYCYCYCHCYLTVLQHRQCGAIWDRMRQEPYAAVWVAYIMGLLVTHLCEDDLSVTRAVGMDVINRLQHEMSQFVLVPCGAYKIQGYCSTITLSDSIYEHAGESIPQ